VDLWLTHCRILDLVTTLFDDFMNDGSRKAVVVDHEVPEQVGITQVYGGIVACDAEQHPVDPAYTTGNPQDGVLIDPHEIEMQGVEDNGEAPIKIKQEASNIKERVSARQSATRRAQIEKHINQLRWESSPELSSRNTVRRRRWPRQYISPEPTTRSKKPRLRRTQKRPDLSVRHASPSHSHSSSLEILVSRPATTPRAGRASQRAERQDDNVGPSSPKEPLHNDLSTSVFSPPPILTPSPSQSLLQHSPRTSKVRFHFFTLDEDFGAIPALLEQCNTADAFFDRATSAYSLLHRQGLKKKKMAAVSVSMEGLPWPMILEWKSVKGYDMMVAEIATVSAQKENLNVKVKCVVG